MSTYPKLRHTPAQYALLQLQRIPLFFVEESASIPADAIFA
ncbi:MAG TPA: hypothetical protein VKX39_15365 [Bryobacteraceae bacterium]|jgi:hypothetical protein|nr:hypothetical protein [Bryobacteraceae bacterium]